MTENLLTGALNEKPNKQKKQPLHLSYNYSNYFGGCILYA